ncbi:MAG TPA: hypothetical protein VMG38_05555 [Trebonia sp.]|nr:hypothetical protein [Trebonia sp.]
MIRYLSGLLVCCLGLFGGGWLIVVVVLLRGTPTLASLASLGTGAGVALVSAVGIACWSVAWRQRMREDGVLATRPRPEPAGAPPGPRAHRSRRALRRDMRHAARQARRTARRDEAARLDEVARQGSAACRDPMARPAAPAGQPQGRDRHPVIPGPRIPLTAEAGHDGRPEAAEPGRPGVVLTELRALLEPLLTTGPMPVLDGEPDDRVAGDLLGEEESW